jgi:hypothetical protein
MATQRVIADNEFRQVVKAQRFLFQRVVNVGTVVVEPDLLRLCVFARFMVIEKQHIRLHPVGVKDAGG